jgi:hypothetical protein
LPDAELGGGLEESLPDGREGAYEVSVWLGGGKTCNYFLATKST